MESTEGAVMPVLGLSNQDVAAAPLGRAFARGRCALPRACSNSARAHDLGRTQDWVVIYYERDGHEEQATAVTETHGPLAGRRVVRGREAECGRLLRPA